MASPTYAQVTQMPPQQAAPRSAALRQSAPLQTAPRSVEEMQRRRDITQGKRPADVPKAAPRAQTPLTPRSGLQTGPDVAGTSHLSADLRRYVDQLVQQYMAKRPAPRDVTRLATNSPDLDVDMMEEDRLAWQQIAAGMRKSPDGDHPILGDQDDVTGDDWESLDNEDLLMDEADPNRLGDTAGKRQVIMQQPDLTSANRQADAPAAQRQLGQQEDPRIEYVSRQTGSSAEQR